MASKVQPRQTPPELKEKVAPAMPKSARRVASFACTAIAALAASCGAYAAYRAFTAASPVVSDKGPVVATVGGIGVAALGAATYSLKRLASLLRRNRFSF